MKTNHSELSPVDFMQFDEKPMKSKDPNYLIKELFVQSEKFNWKCANDSSHTITLKNKDRAAQAEYEPNSGIKAQVLRLSNAV